MRHTPTDVDSYYVIFTLSSLLPTYKVTLTNLNLIINF
jgi:hypothetical protein